MKECRTCGTLKPLEDFHRNSRQKDGRSVWCRSCVSEYGRQRYLRNREQIRSQARARYLEDPEAVKKRVREWRAGNSARRAEWNREWKRKNSEKVRASTARYMADPEHKRRKYEQAVLRSALPEVKARRAEQARMYRQKHRVKRAEREQRRRAQKFKTQVEVLDPGRIWELARGICHICGEPANPERWELDHAIPLCRGGHHTYANVLVSHPHCNRTKNSKLVSELLPEQIGRLKDRSRQAA